MPSELIKQLLEAGVHFGHQTKRWNPKMAKFIFGERSGIYIIDLEKTAECLNNARDFVLDLASKGEMILFAGTKRQAKEVVAQEAVRCGMYWVTERWLGGLLTNFSTIQKSIGRLKEIERMKEEGIFNTLTKKEVASLEKELGKLKKNLGGIIAMDKLPKALYVVDVKKEETAVNEARRLGIPIIALIDTNSNPDKIAYPIPGNDDAIKSISLITHLIAEAVVEGRKNFLSYLSRETAIPKAEPESKSAEAEPAPEKEEAVIKEIEEQVLETEVTQETEKLPKKGRAKSAAGTRQPEKEKG